MSTLDFSDPTLYATLFERTGDAYADPSASAAANRADFAMEIFTRSLISRSPNTAGTEQTVSSPTLQRSDFFTNFGTAPGYNGVPPAGNGRQEAGQEGWIMHSEGPNDSSRLRFDGFVFNTSPSCMIGAHLRGAPDNGKNSYVCLREQAWAEGGRSGFGDEIDIVEIYGQPSYQRAEWAVYQNGVGPVAPGNPSHVYAAPDGLPGGVAYYYTMYLERGNLIRFYVTSSNIGAAPILTQQWDASEGYVPTNPMYLYTGIWDCGSQNIAVDPPGSFTGDSSLALYWLGMYW